ncbi:NrfD/PsrC family molybdoenzyme membrane anchor subunit, partial [Streptomyces montanisoli]
MSRSDVTREGVKGTSPGREALTGKAAGRHRRRRRGGEEPMVPKAKFSSYYGKPVLNKPTWKPTDIAGYLFLGGLAGGSSALAAGAQATGRPGLGRAAKAGAFGAISLSLAALVHDLGRPARFLNMLRVFKPTSPMNVGSWLLSGYAPLAAAATASDLTGRLRPVGAAATAGAAGIGRAGD